MKKIIKENVIDFILYSLLVFGLTSLSFHSYQYYQKSQPVPLVITDPIQLTPHVGASFVPYVKDFLRFAYKNNKKLPHDFKQRLDTLTVKYGQPKKVHKTLVGLCDMNSITVTIDINDWKIYSSNIKQQLIDHELAHCLLGRIHKHNGKIGENDEFESESIMNPFLISENYYVTNKTKLRDELFQFHKYDKMNLSIAMANASWEKLHDDFNNNVEEYFAFINSFINEDINEEHPQYSLTSLIVTKEEPKGDIQ